MTPIPPIPKDLQAKLIERTAVLIAHRACIGAEYDPANGKLHGFCVVCGVEWPCDYAKTDHLERIAKLTAANEELERQNTRLKAKCSKMKGSGVEAPDES